MQLVVTGVLMACLPRVFRLQVVGDLILGMSFQAKSNLIAWHTGAPFLILSNPGLQIFSLQLGFQLARIGTSSHLVPCIAAC